MWLNGYVDLRFICSRYLAGCDETLNVVPLCNGFIYSKHLLPGITYNRDLVVSVGTCFAPGTWTMVLWKDNSSAW